MVLKNLIAFLMISLVTRLIFAVCLLASQTATAVHEFDCVDEKHDQSCEVCFYSDHSASVNAEEATLEPVVHGSKAERFRALVSPQSFVFSYLSRAPPRRV